MGISRGGNKRGSAYFPSNPIASSHAGLSLGLTLCNRHPFVARMQGTSRTRSISRGAARVKASGVVLIAYTASDRRVADDGNLLHSPYTAALLRHLEELGIDSVSCSARFTEMCFRRPEVNRSLSCVVRCRMNNFISEHQQNDGRRPSR
jgi:hypothetical protein